MILGFAHITRNGVLLPRDPVVRARHEIANAPQKWALMVRHADRHTIIIPEPRGCRVPEEIVWYSTGLVERSGRLGVLHDGVSRCVALRARDIATEFDFFLEGLGFTTWSGPYGGTLRLVSTVLSWEVGVLPWVDPKAPIDPPLDIAGYAALAFYSSDVEADRDHLLKHGGRTPTEPFTVALNHNMKIVMLRSPEGTIIELIQIIRPPQGEELEWAKAEAAKLGLK